MAEIHLRPPEDGKKIVSIIPFSDSDRFIAKVLENMINKNLSFDEDVNFQIDNWFEKAIG